MKNALLLLIFACAAVLGPAVARADMDADEARFANWIQRGLLDESVAIESRRQIANEIEQLTMDDRFPDALYVLGSLYSQDPNHSSTPLPQNLDKARVLLSRAALQGQVKAMAKLSTIELKLGNRFEANVWAQLYYHYSQLSLDPNSDPRPGLGFAASIVRSAQEGFPDSQFAAMEAAVGSMLEKHDGQIKAGVAKQLGLAEARRKRGLNPRLGLGSVKNFRAPSGRMIESGVVEFVLEFTAAGKVKRHWCLDAWPNPGLVRIMRNNAKSFRIDTASAEEKAGRIARLDMIFDNRRHRAPDPAHTN